MQGRVQLALVILLAGCGDTGPDLADFVGVWQLTSVNLLSNISAGASR